MKAMAYDDPSKAPIYLAFAFGFAAETENHITHAKIKLQQKNLDWIAVNNVSGNQGFESDDNELTMISNHRQSIIFEKEDKSFIIIDFNNQIREADEY